MLSVVEDFYGENLWMIPVEYRNKSKNCIFSGFRCFCGKKPWLLSVKCINEQKTVNPAGEVWMLPTVYSYISRLCGFLVVSDILCVDNTCSSLDRIEWDFKTTVFSVWKLGHQYYPFRWVNNILLSCFDWCIRIDSYYLV